MVVTNTTPPLPAPKVRSSAVTDAIRTSKGRNDSLPVELLELIFQYAFAGAQQGQPARPDRRRRIRLPFRLAAVCRLWRCVALYNAVLWSDIVVDMCAFKSAVRQAAYLELLLERSSACPLDIYVYYVRNGVPRASCAGFETHLFRHIGQNAHRWRSLRMNVPAACVDGDRVEMFRLQTPLLEELSVDFNFRKGSTGSPFLADFNRCWGQPFLPCCPRLRTLVLQNSGFLRLYPIRWIPHRMLSIQELDIMSAGLDPYDQVRLLHITPDLTRLRFCNFRMYAPETNAYGVMLDFPRLRHLTIPSMAPRLLAAWAPGLYGLHALETLDMTGHEYPALANALRFVRPTVTTLAFTLDYGDVCPYLDAALFRRLARLVRLRELRVERAGEMAPLQLFLALGDGARGMWPELRVLQLRGADLRSDEQAGVGHGYTTGAEHAARALLDFVVSRNAPRAIRKEEALGRAPRARLNRVVLLGCQIDPAILDGMGLLVPVEERPGDSPWVSVP